MQHLWAPWRNSYVHQKEPISSHLFYEIGQGGDDISHHVILRGRCSFALLNSFPYNAGHTMVLPYREVADPSDLSADEFSDLWDSVWKVRDAMQQTIHPHGFNIGINLGSAAGAGIPQHLHIHIVPRWKDDANFMTTTAETRIHPADLGAVAITLRTALQAA